MLAVIKPGFKKCHNGAHTSNAFQTSCNSLEAPMHFD